MRARVPGMRARSLHVRMVGVSRFRVKEEEKKTGVERGGNGRLQIIQGGQTAGLGLRYGLNAKLPQNKDA